MGYVDVLENNAHGDRDVKGFHVVMGKMSKTHSGHDLG